MSVPVSRLLWTGHGSPETAAGSPEAVSGRCWLCAVQSTRTYARADYRKPTWTDDDQAQTPASDRLCPACAWCIDAFRDLRRTAWLATRDTATALARRDIRAVLLSPPAPPFAVLVPTSFQLHLFHRGRVALDASRFPVQFERALVWVAPETFIPLVTHVETLRALGHTIGEIASGRLRGATIRTHGQLDMALALSEALDPDRRTAVFALALHVSHAPDRAVTDKEDAGG